MNCNEPLYKSKRGTPWRFLVSTLFPLLPLVINPSVAAPPQLHVTGNHLEDTRGRTVRLQGVNIPSLDWNPEGEHILESIDVALSTWNAKVIRIPLTQDLWFGYFKGKKSSAQASAYRALVDQVVKRISNKNAYILLDLHWSDGGVWGEHVGQHAMPDTNSVVFWKSVAAKYANNPAVMFDLYNEPHDVTWDIWQKGGLVDERNADPIRGEHLTYRTPGMQTLVETVRKTGAKNIVIAGGLDWAYDLRGVMNGHALRESNGHGIMYATHIYPWKMEWDKHVTPTLNKYAVFVGEVGTKPWKDGDPPHENVYTETWATEVIGYINTHKLSWTAWSFHPGANPCIISGWNYEPTAYWGVQVKSALAPTGVKSKR